MRASSRSWISFALRSGNPRHLVVTLTGHSGGGSFMFGFIEGQDSLPSWLERIAFLDANYNFDYEHGESWSKWLRAESAEHARGACVRRPQHHARRQEGRFGFRRNVARIVAHDELPRASRSRSRDTLGDFVRYHAPQIEILLHPNPANRILHTEMIGEMNGYMHAMLVRRDGMMSSVLIEAGARV